MAESVNSFGVKDLVVAVPLLAAAVGVAFDVGYFLGLDINFFTFFSLSEHLVFALEATPMALIIMGSFVILILAIDVLFVKAAREERAGTSAERRGWRYWVPLVTSWTLLIGVFVWSVYLRNWIIIILVSLTLILMTSITLWPIILLSRRGMIAYAVFGTLLAALA